MSKKWKNAITLLAVMSGVIFLIGHTAVAEGKTLKMRVAYDVQNFDPGMFTLHETSVVLRMIYDNLLDYKPGAWPEMENQLAQRYEISPDGLVVHLLSEKRRQVAERFRGSDVRGRPVFCGTGHGSSQQGAHEQRVDGRHRSDRNTGCDHGEIHPEQT